MTIVSVFGEFFHSDFDENYKTLFPKKKRKKANATSIVTMLMSVFFFFEIAIFRHYVVACHQNIA